VYYYFLRRRKEESDVSAQLPFADDMSDDPVLQAIFDRINSANGRISNIYRVLGNSPELLTAWIDFAWTLRFHPTTPRGLRELAIVRSSQMTGTPYELAAHTPMALDAGVTDEQLAVLASWRDSNAFGPDERLVLEATEMLTATTALDDDMRSRLLDRFGPEQTVEVVLTIAFYSCVSRVLKGLGVPLEAAEADTDA
jgi:AhpD family alkylhydroperoxidase